MKSLAISAFTSTSAAGIGNAALQTALAARRSGLQPCTLAPDLHTFTGAVAGLDAEAITGALARFDCRNNRLARLALAQDGFAAHVMRAREQYGPARVAVILGTSTSGIGATEDAYRARDAAGALPRDFDFAHTHNLYASTDYVRAYFDLHGPAAMVSTACSSSAKVFASAYRLLAAGLCDAAIVGGVDSLCRNTLYGFSALELVAPTPCRPCSADRGGISIGEAAGFALLEWPARAPATDLRLLGYGESADAYHMSTPRPDGAGAALAMQRALDSADLSAGAIDYINMHGTASRVNDAMEDKAISAVFGRETACSATKGWTGHTLGAAGITEAAITWVSLRAQMLPGTLNIDAIDPTFTSRVLLANESARVRAVMSNSFGFGGSNCSLIFGRAA